MLNPKLPNYYFSCEIRCCQTDQSHTKLTLTTVAFGAWSIVRDQVLRLFGPLCKDPQYMLLLHLVDELLPLLFFLYNTVFQGGDFDHWFEVLLRVSLMFITIRRRNYDKATKRQWSDVIHHLKDNAEVSSTIQEFLKTLTEKKVEIFHSVLRRLVTSLHPVSLCQTTDGNPSTLHSSNTGMCKENKLL